MPSPTAPRPPVSAAEIGLGALREGLPASELWSLLLDVFERRAAARTPARLVEQWNRDGFTRPAYVDQRTLVALDAELLAAAAAFEAIELSPLAPLGTCSAVALASQNKDRLELHGYEFPERRVRLLATPARASLGERIEAAIRALPSLRGAALERQVLDHAYYDGGLRFTIETRSTRGEAVVLVDGGAFDWVGKLAENRRLAYVASGMGAQLATLLFRPGLA